MSTTSAYGWNIPDNTDLVKDGALAIRTLGNAIDTSMNTALGTKKAGLVLLNTTSFSAVSSQSVSDVFSATYSNYVAILSLQTVTTATSDFSLRLRVSGTDAATAYSNYYTGVNSASGAQNSINNSSTSLFLSSTHSSLTVPYVMSRFEIVNPNVATPTLFTVQSLGLNSSGQFAGFSGAGLHDAATAYTGLTIIRSSGTMTGQIQVFGFNK